MICSIILFSVINVQASERQESSNLLFEERISQAEKQFMLEPNVLEDTNQVSPQVASLGVSACVGSGCAGSVCVGSGCFYSICVGSACTQSGCVGSGCVNSGCGGSVCIGSFCKSACLGLCK